MSTRKNNYATLATPGTKKISVCARRVGSRERMSVIAVCTDETAAEKIVDGLNMLQGEVAKLEVPAQRTLVEVRQVLDAERAASKTLQSKVRELKSQLREMSYKVGRIQLGLDRAVRERDVAQKAALEKA